MAEILWSVTTFSNVRLLVRAEEEEKGAQISKLYKLFGQIMSFRKVGLYKVKGDLFNINLPCFSLS